MARNKRHRSIRTAFSASALPVLFCAFFFGSSSSTSQPSPRISSNVAWTRATIDEASHGEALRGLLIAKHCEHCHGSEGFSAIPDIPNLAGMDRLSFWKQMLDFASRKRNSAIMSPIVAPLSHVDVADLAAYYSLMPTSDDPLEKRAFPRSPIRAAQSARAGQLIVLGDGQRGIPPCQSCHGPVGFKNGAPSLSAQNEDYLFNQLRDFSVGARSNDINMPMRTVAALLTDDERHALAAYYGSGRGQLPAGTVLEK